MTVHYLLAQAYGQNAYSSGLYSADAIQIGPIILPVTGAGLLAIIVIAIGVGLFVWARQRRKRKTNLPSSTQTQ